MPRQLGPKLPSFCGKSHATVPAAQYLRLGLECNTKGLKPVETLERRHLLIIHTYIYIYISCIHDDTCVHACIHTYIEVQYVTIKYVPEHSITYTCVCTCMCTFHVCKDSSPCVGRRGRRTGPRAIYFSYEKLKSSSPGWGWGWGWLGGA